MEIANGYACSKAHRHPLTYDYNRQGPIIVVHAHSHRGRGEAVTRTPFVAGGSEEIVVEVRLDVVPDYEECIGARSISSWVCLPHAGPPQGSNSFATG